MKELSELGVIWIACNTGIKKSQGLKALKKSLKKSCQGCLHAVPWAGNQRRLFEESQGRSSSGKTVIRNII